MGIACLEDKWGLANDNEERLPKRVDPRIEAETAFPMPEVRLNGIPGGGARGEGSNMTKFEIGPSKIESISKRLGMAMNPSRTASFADRADSVIREHRKTTGIGISGKIIHICMSRELTCDMPFDSLPAHHVLE
jgi:hypothetical protein